MLCLRNPRKTLVDGRIKLTATVESEDGVRDLWFSLPEAFADHVREDSLDPFALGLLFEASQTGQAIRIDGRISDPNASTVSKFYR
jgi:hypothetical protein